ncbi:MAG: 3-phosphoglycerate dehydrogenase [Betaproteobacteria bacterium RIFCSPLOWO2_02_FULL_67_26]|nr:MAG: 3-phosphoglycerate dehydrogenase [Betaproteobacteria bacterium RIFCSPLOWO2_02_FULL_67_26]
MKIAVLDDYQDVFRTLKCFPKLKGHDVAVYHDSVKEPTKLAERLKGADAVILLQQRTPFPRAAAEKVTTLKLISQTGRNANHIDLAACTEKGIMVCGTGAGVVNHTAELTWGLIFSALRHIPDEVQQLKAGRWQTTIGTTVVGKTLGIYAYGRIGSIVARAGRAFEMKVICWGREGSTGRARADGFEVAASREAFFENADIVSLHIPLNKETRGIVAHADLARMKPTALVVNTSRGPIIEKDALVKALKEGRPGFGAVDVFDDEPVLGGDHPLLKMKNAVCTPHLGYVDRDTYEKYYGAAVDSILAFAGGKPANVLNPDVLKKA